MTIRFVPLSAANISQVLALKASESQCVDGSYVSQTLAWHSNSLFWSRAILEDQTNDIVGVFVVNLEIDDQRSPALYLPLVDAKFQGRGYGSAAMRYIIDTFRPQFKHLSVSTASSFFERFGFRANQINFPEGNFPAARVLTDAALPPVELRPVDATNLQQILEMNLHPGGIVTHQTIAKILTKAGVFLYWRRAVYLNKTLVGVVVLNMEPDDGDVPFLNLIAIDANFQAQRLGTAVVQELVRRLGRNSKRLRTSTSPTIGPIRFYKSLGFSRIGMLPNGAALLALEL